MTCARQDLKVFWTEQLAKKRSQLDKANATLEALLDDQTQSWQLDTTEGEQRVMNKRVDHLKEVIDALEKEIAQLIRKLHGCGNLVNLNMRRVV
jgi:flagellar biosynthesis chaperone FliJ